MNMYQTIDYFAFSLLLPKINFTKSIHLSVCLDNTPKLQRIKSCTLEFLKKISGKTLKFHG